MKSQTEWILLCRKNTLCLMWGFLALMISGITTPGYASPITFNTALPVTKGEGIFRIQSKLIRSTGNPSPMDRELEGWAFPIVGVYGLTEELALFGIAPIFIKNLDVTTPAGHTRQAKRQYRNESQERTVE